MQISQPVRVRGARWRIADIRTHEDCQVVTLAGTSAAHALVEQRVLAPFDDIEPIVRNRRPRFVRSGRWWRACRLLLADTAPPGALRSVHRARIEIMAHQLEPALSVVRGSGSRVLLADEVGLGKTIQAGIIVSELLVRGAADRVLVVAPAGLRDQWCEELAGRFRLEPYLADAASMRRLSATLPLGINPWITEPIVVTSVDYAKRPEVLPAVAAVCWDVVIVDEAHATAGDSDRQIAVGALTARAAYVLLLTATPHSGDARSFASLCRCGEAGDQLLVFRRRRSDVRRGAIRRIHTVLVRTSPEERRLHALLDRYVAAVRAESAGAWLAASVLHKRALSSAWSLARSVEKRLSALDGSGPPSGEQLQLPFANADGEFAGGDDEPAWPGGVGLADASREMRLLRLVLAAARVATARETKLNALVRLLRRAGEPAIVFTEYRDTLLHVRRTLSIPSLVLHGGLTRAERAASIRDFMAGGRPLLLATDAGAEGLNLHYGCRLVINLELPWNPMRLEQRIGRVDRVGQRRTVHAFHLVSASTAERRILARLKARVARAAADIGAPDPVGGIEEQAIARIVVLGTHPNDGELAESAFPKRSTRAGAPAAHDAQSADIVPHIRPDLSHAAECEAARLTVARRLLDRVHAGKARRVDSREDVDGRFEHDGPLICRGRRSVLREGLHGGVLMLWRIACEDGCGRPAEWALVPMMVELRSAPIRWTWKAIDDLRQNIEALFGVDRDHSLLHRPGSDLPAIGRIGSESDTRPDALPPAREVVAFIQDSRAEVRRFAQDFWSARLSRERAIQSCSPVPQAAGIQPGLFDRRAERAWLAGAAARTDADSDRQGRLAALERASVVVAAPPRLLLVLLP